MSTGKIPFSPKKNLHYVNIMELETTSKPVTDEVKIPVCSRGCTSLNCKNPDNCEFDKLDK